MKQFTFFITFFTLFAFWSCNQSDDENESDAYFESDSQFNELRDNLNKQFTESAGYQSIMLSFDERMGNTVLVKVAPNMEENKVEEWFYMNESWKKEAEDQLELDNKKMTDLLFVLKDDYDLSLLLSIVDKSKEKIKTDFNLKNVTCKSINLIMNKERTAEKKMDDLITQATVEDDESGTSYKVNFDANGNVKY